ncbi:hypothetical protein [Marinobacter metalliresistant]|uniref:Uncharacterized protein n=1 Tax=Marinobacter metalliresistant TaxID=2961995 RepID=A0ABZ2VYJ5_9GAMM
MANLGETARRCHKPTTFHQPLGNAIPYEEPRKYRPRKASKLCDTDYQGLDPATDFLAQLEGHI